MLAALVCWSCVDTAQAGGWLTHFESAESASKKTGRPILVHFYADWCGPCRQMDSSTLRHHQVTQFLSQAVVGVKVNADHRQDLVRRFGISSLPTDLIVRPDGKILARHSGYSPPSRYLSTLARAANEGRQRPATTSRNNAIAKEGTPQQAVAGPSPRTEQGRAAEPPPKHTGRPATRETSPPPVMIVSTRPPMLRGYSPVALHESREWVKGRAEHAVEYRGQIYRLASAAEKTQFLENPRRYTPRLLGCDAVSFSENDRAIPGRLEYAAFYGEELYLFTSDEHRRRFKQQPERFTSTRIVKLEDIEAVVR